MNDKYYTPSIEEFHVGFECEYYSSHADKFISIVLNESNFSTNSLDGSFDDDYVFSGNYHSDNKFRVKYLDSEDIESLGFDKTAEYGKYIEFNDNIKAFNPSSTKLLYNTDTNLINIESFTFEEESSLPLFHGIVKNKSELVRLLKQLNIIK